MSAPASSRRRIVWLLVAAGAVALADRVLGPGEPDGAVVAAVTKDRVRPAAGVGERASGQRVSVADAASRNGERELDRLERWQRAQPQDPKDADGSGLDPFAAVTWAAPAASAAARPPAPPPPPAPVAPTFPYAYIGGLVEDGIRTAFFARGERVLPVQAGDTVDGSFRIDEIDDRQMKLTYVPMNQSAVIALRSK